jgi:hypothetical protein
MTTWYNHAATAFDPETGLFSEDMKALVTNPIAIGEADSTVPLNLLPTVLLAWVGTPSGSSVTVTSLNLTPYKTLKVFLNGVSATRAGSGFNLLIGGQNCAQEALSSATFTGVIDIDLFNGVFAPSIYGAQFGVSASLTTAATSLTLAVNSTAAFTGGSFRVYGCK